MKPTPKRSLIPIVCGILRKGDRLLVTRRREGSHLAGAWEFPGGKARPGEALEAALRREVEEEIGVTFAEACLIHVKEHAYADRTVLLHFYLCLDPREEPSSLEGQELRWIGLAELEEIEVPAANREVLELLREQFGDA